MDKNLIEEIIAQLHELFLLPNQFTDDAVVILKAIAVKLGGSSENADSWIRYNWKGDLHHARLAAAVDVYQVARKNGLTEEAQRIADLVLRFGILLQNAPTGSVWLRDI